MRCLNCQTVLMDTDRRCPVCGMATGVEDRVSDRAAWDPNLRRKMLLMKWLGGPLLVLAGALMALGGGVMLHEAQYNAPKPREVTADDLIKIQRPEELTDWISYVPTKTLETPAVYQKLRSGQVTSKFILLQVQDRWLMAKVDPRFGGMRVEGKLEDLDTVQLPTVRASLPRESQRLLTYQIDAEYDIAGTQRQNTIFGGFLGGFGLLMLFTGGGLVLLKVPPAIVGGTAEAASQGRVVLQVNAPPQPRGCLLPAVCTAIWAAVFFFLGAIAFGFTAQMGIDDPELQKQAVEESGKKYGLIVLLGSLGLAVVLGSLGKLPGTRR